MLGKIVSIIMLALFTVLPVFGESIELGYDDGSPSAGFRGGIYENVIYAVRFTPPSGEWLLSTARYYITTPGHPARVRVFNSSNGEPGSDLFPGFNVTPQSTGWLDVDLRDADIRVTGEFFVGLEMLSLDPTENPGLGADTEGNDRSWNHVGDRWLFNQHTTYFIRAVVTDEVGFEEELIPESAISLGCFPNPFSQTTTIRYTQQKAGRVSLSIRDANGRCVRVLIDSNQAAGNHCIRWDGKDNRGTALPTGVYFLKMETQQSRLRQKLILAR